MPANHLGWRERHKSACAFLNTRGGILIFGVKEEGTGGARKYVFTGWRRMPSESEGVFQAIHETRPDRRLIWTMPFRRP